VSAQRLLPIACLAGVLVGIQLGVSATGRAYYLTQLIMSAYYALVVLGLCMLMGYAGQISLGHGAFFAIGGYTSALLTTRHLASASGAPWAAWLSRAGILMERTDPYGKLLVTFSPWLAFLIAMLLTLVIAATIGYPSLRLRGHYLAMATLGFGLIIYRVLLGSELFGSADGISGVPPWRLVPGLAVDGRREARVANYYIAWGLVSLALVFLLNLAHSRIGRALRAIHDNEPGAAAMGIDAGRHKLQVFLLSAVLAACAGCFLTHYNGGIGPSEAGAMKSVRYVALVAAGGMANLWGALVVSTVLNYLSLRGYFGTFDHAVFGVILILIISLAPDGPLKAIGAWLRRGAACLRPERGGVGHGPS